MRLCMSGAEKFLLYTEGKMNLGDVLADESYRLVFAHAERFGTRLTEADVSQACLGVSTPFYGMSGLAENRSRIDRLLRIIRSSAAGWLAEVDLVFGELIPGADLEAVTVYPLIGYDMGIGLRDGVCMNLNTERYLEHPNEFLYYMVHEIFHVIYERIHGIRPLREIVTPNDWYSYFAMFTQNEGFAVYAPWKLRERMGELADRDYQILLDHGKTAEHIGQFLQTLSFFTDQPQAEPEEFLERCFGPNRLTYRVGCEMIRRMEATYGFPAVQAAVFLSGEEFVERYVHLLQRG